MPSVAPAATPAAVLQLPIDVDKIARKALSPPAGKCPDDVIERELRRAGVPGDFPSSREFRALWHLCATTYSDLRAQEPSRDLATITAAEFWALYARGASQHEMARRWGLGAGAVAQRSMDLGFVLRRGGDKYRPGHVVSQGPCVRCGTSYAVARLDAAHVCDICRGA